jgi:hypothetical protein
MPLTLSFEMTRLLKHMLRVNITVSALLLACAELVSCDSAKPNQAESARIRTKLEAIPLNQKVQFTNDEWKYILTSRQYYVLRKRGTELPFTNAYWHAREGNLLLRGLRQSVVQFGRKI